MPGFLWLSGLCLGVASLTLQYDSSPMFVRAHETTILTLGITGIYILALCILIPKLWGADSVQLRSIQLPILARGNVPLGRHLWSATSRQAKKILSDVTTLDLTLLITAICSRFELFRRTIARGSCAGASFEPLVPFLVILFDRAALRTRRIKLESEKGALNPPSPSSYTIRNSPSSLVMPLFALSLSTMLLLRSASGPNSTYICAISLPWAMAVPLYQLCGCLCDAQIVISIYRIIYRSREDERPIRRIALIGGALLISSFILSIISAFFYASGNDRFWNRLTNSPSSSPFAFAFVVAFAFVCALQVILRLGLIHAVIAVLATVVNYRLILNGLRFNGVLPSISSTPILFLLACSFFSIGFSIRASSINNSGADGSASKTSRRGTKRVYVGLMVLFGIHAYIWIARPGLHGLVHPIHTLMEEAEERHAKFREEAMNSTTLEEAAATYRQKYGRDPPARFNKWYNYAQLNEALIIDNYDSLHEDLLPFWSLSPKEIRERTGQLINTQDNFIGGVFIRKKNLALGGNFPETHRWMLEGVAHIISPFAKHLPDMDLAINLMDEPRVAVPNKEIKKLRDEGEAVRYQELAFIHRDFEASREKAWPPLLANPSPGSMVDRTFQPTFDEFGTIGCPESSRARTELHWDSQALCDSCACKHSTLHFVSNWTLARDPCHQPDLANLHGFYMSPSSFKGTHRLMPVFSQSKLVGFNDIVYPSVWNYNGKVVYEPTDRSPDREFAKKEPTLFWRGTASDGGSANNGAWQGMLRQRAVHLLTNASSITRSLVLLPDSARRSKDDDENDGFSLRSFSSPDLRRHLSTSVRFAGEFQRCMGHDCSDQEAEFAARDTPHIDFQGHWKYKYLLDLDGAGFSTRFLPFLMSRSLVFRASLMRSWFDDRLVAWKHFVPLDIRLREIWSVLAYFAGWRADGRSVLDVHRDGKKVRWLVPPHDDEAEAIATAGREWANEVLRKEDMEVYMFRLLLEWARLTDDKRDELGYRW